MGGHGGLNILPQKKWNVYNYENREKVRQDEESAAREEQLKLEQSRRRDAEFRIEKLRRSRNLPNPPSLSPSTCQPDARHINFFDGIENAGKKRRREDVALKVQVEDEKYKLGYGLVGKGVETPWYASKASFLSADGLDEGEDGGRFSEDRLNRVKKNNLGRKTVEELREERMKRERKEKEREKALLVSM